MSQERPGRQINAVLRAVEIGNRIGLPICGEDEKIAAGTAGQQITAAAVSQDIIPCAPGDMVRAIPAG